MLDWIEVNTYMSILMIPILLWASLFPTSQQIFDAVIGSMPEALPMISHANTQDLWAHKLLPGSDG